MRAHDFLGAPFATFGRRVLVARARLFGGAYAQLYLCRTILFLQDFPSEVWLLGRAFRKKGVLPTKRQANLNSAGLGSPEARFNKRFREPNFISAGLGFSEERLKKRVSYPRIDSLNGTLQDSAIRKSGSIKGFEKLI